MKKTVLVTGSSRGIGRAVALKFASCGYRVVINCARSAERMEEVKKEIESWARSVWRYRRTLEIRMTVNVFFRRSNPTSDMWTSS